MGPLDVRSERGTLGFTPNGAGKGGRGKGKGKGMERGTESALLSLY